MTRLPPGAPRIRHWHLTDDEKDRRAWERLYNSRVRRERQMVRMLRGSAAMRAAVQQPDWTGALCAGLGVMFFAPDIEPRKPGSKKPSPDETRPAREQERITAARQMCQRCPLRAECLDYAYRTGQQYGIWGGVNFDSEEERSAA